MAKNSDEIKGRAKEAAGAVTGNKKLKSEGKADQITGKVKSKVRKTEAKVEGLIDKSRDGRPKK